jgi:hypothetical protein
MLTKFWLMAWFATSAPVLADTLASGSVYFDSQQTLEEVVKLSAAKDNESILKLINSGHVSQQTDSTNEIIILATGLTSESPAEFRFTNEPTTYWTLTKFLTRETVVAPTPTPMPEESPAPSATPERPARVTQKRHPRDSEDNDPLDDDNGQRIWHKVDGRWKWYPAHRTPVRKALPPNGSPSVAPPKPATAP